MRYVATAIVTVGVAVGSAAVAAPAIVHAAPADCAATFNLFIPGTWETNEAADPAQPIGMLKPIAEAIQRKQGPHSDIYFTPYMARAFDNGYTYADSKNTALTKARTTLRAYGTRCPAAKFTLTGYSQGADAAGDLASEIGNDRGPVPADRVLAVGLLADPGAGTKGEIAVGPRTAGTGIADPRPQGMGKLSGRVTSICDPGDLYCSIQKNLNPLLGKLGSLLSTIPSESKVATALTSDFSKADLPGIGNAVGELAAGLTTPGGIDLAQVRAKADKLANTIDPLADLIDSGAANRTAARLAAAPAGTAEHNAGEVLLKAGESDLAAATAAVKTIEDTAAQLLDRGVSTLQENSPDAAALTTAAEALNGQVAPLVSVQVDVLGSASDILSLLKPSALVNQSLDVVANVTALDFPAILRNLTLLGQKVAAMDAHGAHQVAGELNNQFQPLVKLIAGADVKQISQVLSAIPNSQGYIQFAALATSILSGVDVLRLANIVGRIQEVAWSVIEKLVPPPGQQPDLAGAAAALSGLLPVGQELASVAIGPLTSKIQALDLGDLAAAPAQPPRGINLFALIGDGLSAASFFTSSAHINYGSLVVDNKGRNAIQWLGDWLNQEIGRAN
ncbi:cutinase family protein [Nocardia brasiliensis]|uniref:cutinase family protein n=1 Tax=Nocardia brasiliensis TaxID=37326 RepID=UPI003672CCD9